MTVAELVQDWQTTHGATRAKRTQGSDRSRVKRLVAYWGDTPAEGLTAADIAHYVEHELETVAGWTIAGCLSLLRVALNLRGLPYPRRQMGKTIQACQRLGRESATTRDAWSHEEAASLLQAAQEHAPRLYPVLRFALATGARRGAVLAMRWEDVQWKYQRVQIRRALQLRSQGTKPPKNGNGRLCPVSLSFLGYLRELQIAQQPPAVGGWMFPNTRGELQDEDNFSRSYRLLQDRLPSDVRRLPFHCCRHTFITWALEAGTSAKKVSEWVGATIAVIESTYAHAIPPDGLDVSFADIGLARQRRQARSPAPHLERQHRPQSLLVGDEP